MGAGGVLGIYVACSWPYMCLSFQSSRLLDFGIEAFRAGEIHLFVQLPRA
jgi:hypothetical protein